MAGSKFDFELEDLLDFHEENDDTGIPGPTAMGAVLREHGKDESGKLLETTAASQGYSELQYSTTNMGQLMMGMPVYKDQDTNEKQQNYLLSSLLGDSISREETKGKLGGNFDDQVPRDVSRLAKTRIDEKGLYTDPDADWGLGSGSSTAPVSPVAPDTGSARAVSGVRSNAGSASDRGWGPGWPNCPESSQTTISFSNGMSLQCHQRIAPLVKWLIEQTNAGGYECKKGICGGFNCRQIRGRTSPSNHSWGLAIDINAPSNPMQTGPLVTDMPQWMVQLWKSKGFGWGGDYSTRKDAMHYEFNGTPQDADRYIAQLPG